MKSIEVSDITKTYNGRTVVDRLSFSVDKGEVFGLLDITVPARVRRLTVYWVLQSRTAAVHVS